ncbi:MAG: transcriptional regulator [Terriglobia bacterium]|nr:MAG: transcriptional regulator [Terriglobia bacterium]
MPLYEYSCSRCHETFEVMQKFSDPPLATHEGCGGEVERLLSPPALQFKGSGWYVTDYARNSGGAQKTSDGKSETKSEDKSAPKAETKTESSASPKTPSAKP